ncbi:8724_t:CDS:2 [Scutellospora calospora]|uniref:8724_t:CDS:1 n=1 Tax=Scutellospora calospora TaxID=85575 RepID=A0ACA9KRR1_9GLOM|nr:8724_t:CDS:2 [Scutellospora calospora]
MTTLIFSHVLKPRFYPTYSSATFLTSKYLKHKNLTNINFQSISHILHKPFTSQREQLKGWRKYALQFRSKPTTYIISFAVLHELTAIVPIPIIYVFLSKTNIEIPFPQQALDEGNKFINRIVIYYGYSPFENGSRKLLNFATSYAIVKALMPVRIAACVAMTPWVAEKVIGPFNSVFKRIVARK